MAFPASVDDLHTAIPAEVTPGSEGHYDHHRAIATAVEAVETEVLAGIRKSAPVTLSSADILDLHNTPVTVVAAPGAGKYLVFHRYDAHYTYGTVGYATLGNGVSLAYGAAGTDIFAVAGASLSGSVSKVYRAYEDATHDAVDIINQPIVLVADAGAMTDGDGTLTAHVWYSIEDVP